MTSMERVEQRDDPQRVPQSIDDEPGLVLVDAASDSIQLMVVAAGVRIVGGAEIIDHLDQGIPVIDGRTGDFNEASTIPHAANIPHPEAAERMDTLDQDRPAVFFCNGPQCGQSPHANRTLLDPGYPPEKILYYRGGLADQLTLGLPTVPGGDDVAR